MPQPAGFSGFRPSEPALQVFWSSGLRFFASFVLQLFAFWLFASSGLLFFRSSVLVKHKPVNNLCNTVMVVVAGRNIIRSLLAGGNAVCHADADGR